MALPIELLGIFLRDFIIFLAIYLIVALSLNLEYGYAGVPNFGKVLRCQSTDLLLLQTTAMLQTETMQILKYFRVLLDALLHEMQIPRNPHTL